MEIGTVQRVDIDETMRSAYLNYAMSVITSRALPDVRDGLKPVQRRILYAMHDMGLRHDRPTRKSARIVGEVLGKYHPHGDSAVYDAMVRMARDFTMRYTLVDGQGNFGSIDGDEAAAMRYTEARLSAVGEEMLLDLNKETVDMLDNFDGSLQEPMVLPAKFPNLLVNGGGGIAVGMATKIPPHNLGEIVDAIVYLLDRYDTAEEATVDELMQFVKGPDFPTGGIIVGKEGIRQAYATGKGRVVTRAHMHIEDLSGGRSAIVVTEIPYQVNRSTLLERIATLVRDGRVEGIGNLRDESDRTGMRIVIELRRSVDWKPVMRELCKHSQMRDTFGVNMLALVDGEPRTLSLKRALIYYIEHRIEVITRRTEYQLEKARARAHILEGLLLALDQLDAIIDTIRRSRRVDTAQRNLCRKFDLTEIQAQAILQMQLRRLAGMERRKIQDEYEEMQAKIEHYEGLLADRAEILGVIRDEALDLKARYNDARRTRIASKTDLESLTAEDLAPSRSVGVVLTGSGLVRRMPMDYYQEKVDGLVGQIEGEGDTLRATFVCESQARLFFFTDKGRVASVLAHQLPDATQEARGLPLSSFISMGQDDEVVGVVRAIEFDDESCVSMVSRKGRVKRVTLGDLSSVGREPEVAMGLDEDDRLMRALRTLGDGQLIIVTEQGKAIRFEEEDVRPQGLPATGVIGVDLQEGDRAVDMDLVRKGGHLLIVSSRGFAKRTPVGEYSAQNRAGQGALTMDADKLDKTGPLVNARVIVSGEELVFTTTVGRMVQKSFSKLRRTRRASWGRLVTKARDRAIIKVKDDERMSWLLTLERAPDEDQDTEDGDGDAGSAAKQQEVKQTKKGRSKSNVAAKKSAKAETNSDSKPRSSKTSAAKSSEVETEAEASAESDAQEEMPEAGPKRSGAKEKEKAALDKTEDENAEKRVSKEEGKAKKPRSGTSRVSRHRRGGATRRPPSRPAPRA